MKTLYFDCFSGISGDMIIGALLDINDSFEHLESELNKLSIPEDEYKIKMSKINKNGIYCTKFDVSIKSKVKNKDNKKLINNHRKYKDIVEMIRESKLSDKVKQTSINIFTKIGEAEAKIHNMPLKEVHFHEVGSIDSIIDIVSVSILLDKLEVNSIKCSFIPLGFGKVNIEHGVYPVPAPATLEIIRGLPIQVSNINSEITTPTGAAVISVLSDEFCPEIPSMVIKNIGYGAGTKDFKKQPNVLRTIIGEI